MAEIGYISLILAFIVSLYAIVVFAVGAKQNRASLITNGRRGVVLVFILVSLSALVLEIALVTHNFQLEYVTSYTSRDLSLPYLVSSWWAGNAGSLLFWNWILSLSAMIFVLKKREDKALLPCGSAIVMFIQAFFLVMLIFAKNPFTKLDFIPADGRGLNPLLENPAMVIHPPFLLCGYVLFSIPFALAIAALLSKKLDNEWIIRARGWVLLSWLLLGVGNIIGAWWAYVELGWGGYWAWDPVENAGLMPWLLATAFLHSINVQRHRGMFKKWTMTLIILTFMLTIFGTFLTRSDLLSSVHTFGENTLVPFFLTFLFIVFFGSFTLLYHRRDKLKSEASLKSLVSRESAYLVNILLLLASTLIIFVGTISPALAEAVSGRRLVLGESFFNTVSLPIFMAIVFLTGLCIIIGWRQLVSKEFRRSILWPMIVALGIVIGLLVARISEWQAIIAFAVCGFVIAATSYQWLRELTARRRAQVENPQAKTISGFLWANKNRYGAYAIHMAIVLITIGIIGSSVYATEKEAILKPGESMRINQYTLNYDKMTFSFTEDKMIISTSVSVYQGKRLVAQLTPEKYIHRNYEQPVTEVAIRSTPVEDLDVILADWDINHTAAFKVLVNPLVMWLWIGGGVLFLGGLICFWPQRVNTEPPKSHQGNQATFAKLETPKPNE
ncbi:heme lyase CcmF/NrfE family subunit [Chloroflexota bacterium]